MTGTNHEQPVGERARPDATTPSHQPHTPIKSLRVGVRVVLILAVLFVGVAVFALLFATKRHSKPRAEAPPAVLVRSVVAEAQPIDRVWDGFGTVRSMRRSLVAAEVTGRVVDRPASVEPGRSIDAGGVLFEIDPSDYVAARTRAEQAAVALRAQLDGLAVESERVSSQLALVADEIEAAQRDFERTRTALDQGAGTQGELDAKLSSLRRAQREQDAIRQAYELIPTRRLALEGELGARAADLDVAQRNLDRTRVVSPIGGTIESVTPREGDWVNAGTPVAEIIDLSRLEIPIRVPASSGPWIKVGDEVSVWQGEPVGAPSHAGRVTRRGPSADDATRTITVYVEVEQDPARPDRLLPGAFVHARLRTPDPTPRVIVPRRAIRSGRVMALVDADEPGSFIVRPIPVRTEYAFDAPMRDVDPDETEWSALAPTDALPKGVRVATTSLEAIVAGMTVRLESDTPAGANP